MRKARALKIAASLIVRARSIAKDPQKLQELLNKTKRLMTREGLKGVKDDVLLMISYVKDVTTGKYKDFHTKNLMVVIGALLYIVLPIDAIPDFIPIQGWADDIFVIGWALQSIREEMDQYRNRIEEAEIVEETNYSTEVSEK